MPKWHIDPTVCLEDICEKRWDIGAEIHSRLELWLVIIIYKVNTWWFAVAGSPCVSGLVFGFINFGTRGPSAGTF